MKRFVMLFTALVLTFSMTMAVKAVDVDDQTIETIMSEIRQEQAVVKDQDIDVSKVSVDALEKLGDAVMEKIIGNSSMHERMDINLGGEGSDNLTAVHTRIGMDYLLGRPINFRDIIGGGMMGHSYMMRNNDFWNYSYRMDSFWWMKLLMGFVVLMIIIGIIAYAMTQMRKRQASLPNDSALEIARRRFASGEISKEEFDSIKEHLKN